MKQAYALVAGVALLLMAWWALGPKGEKTTFANLEIPADSTDSRTMALGVPRLWASKPGHFDPEQVVTYLGLLANRLDDSSFGIMSAPLFHAWKVHRSAPAMRSNFLALNETFLPRLVAHGSFEELEGVVRVAMEKSFDSVQIDRVLEEAAKRPIRVFDGSKPALVVGAAVNGGDFPRAAKLLMSLMWDADAEKLQRSMADKAASAVRLLASGQSAAKEIGILIRSWVDLEGTILGSSSLLPSFENLLLALMETDVRPPGFPSLASLIKESSKEAGADRFWRRIIHRFSGRLIKAAPVKTRNFADVLEAVATEIKIPDCRHSSWMRAGQLTQAVALDDPLRAAEYYRRAVTSPCADADRASVLKKLLPLYLDRLEFATARQVAEECLAVTKDPVIRAEIETLLIELRKKEGEDAARVARDQKNVEEMRQRGLLGHLEAQLKALKDRKAPEAEIQALERMIKVQGRRLPE